MTNDQPTKQPASQPPHPPSISCSLAIEGRRGEAAFQSASCSSQLAQSPSHRTPQGRKCLKTPRPAPHLLTRPIARGRGPPCINAKPHVAVHLRLLRPFRHPPYVPQALLLALAGEHFSRGGNLNQTDFHHRIRILCWCTTSTSPTRTTTRCWSPTPSPCGARRRSGPRKNSSPS